MRWKSIYASTKSQLNTKESSNIGNEGQKSFKTYFAPPKKRKKEVLSDTVITLSVDGFNSPVRRQSHRITEWIKNKTKQYPTACCLPIDTPTYLLTHTGCKWKDGKR